MAKLIIGSGFAPTIQDEARLHEAAKGLPADWEIRLDGRSTTGVFKLTIRGQAVEVGYKLFAPDHVEEAVRWLRRLKPPELEG
jgi:hypothetical protein